MDLLIALGHVVSRVFELAAAQSMGAVIGCQIIGSVNEFALVASNLWYVLLAIDLIKAIRNPFRLVETILSQLVPIDTIECECMHRQVSYTCCTCTGIPTCTHTHSHRHTGMYMHTHTHTCAHTHTFTQCSAFWCALSHNGVGILSGVFSHHCSVDQSTRTEWTRLV